MANDPKKTQPAEGATPASGSTPSAATSITLPVSELESFIAKLGESIGAGVVKALREEREAQRPGVRKPAKREVPPEYQGAHTYIVGPKGAYQNGRRFVAGERITVVDQFPASDWKPLEDAEAPAKSTPAAKAVRASDQNVG